METSKWEEEKEKRTEESLRWHARLSKLYREDPFAFEREKKRMIDEVINSAEDEKQREKLKALQNAWDKKMKGAGSKHNRFVLAQSFFWDHFHETWYPTLQKFNGTLKGGSDNTP